MCAGKARPHSAFGDTFAGHASEHGYKTGAYFGHIPSDTEPPQVLQARPKRVFHEIKIIFKRRITRILDSAINEEILWLTALKPTYESATRTADENHIAGDRVPEP